MFKNKVRGLYNVKELLGFLSVKIGSFIGEMTERSKVAPC